MKPRQWSLAKQSSLNVENGGPKLSKQVEAKRDGVINLKITISINFNIENFDAFKTLRINRGRP